MVMGLEAADYDIATSARPEEIVKIFPRTESTARNSRHSRHLSRPSI